MGTVKTLTITLALSVVLTIVAGLGRVVAGETVSTTAGDLVLLVAALWVVLFVAFVVMDGWREWLYRRDAERAPVDRRRAAIGGRFVIGAAMLCLAFGRMAMLHLGGELTLWRAWFAVVSAALAGAATIVVLEWAARRKQRISGST